MPLPLSAGEGGPKPKAWGVRVFSDSGVQTLTSHRFAAGPSSPAKAGEGFRLDSFVVPWKLGG